MENALKLGGTGFFTLGGRSLVSAWKECVVITWVRRFLERTDCGGREAEHSGQCVDCESGHERGDIGSSEEGYLHERGCMGLGQGESI